MMKKFDQITILTSTIFYCNEKVGWCVNYFCGASRRDVYNHYDDAVRIYKDIFRDFIGAWFIHRDECNIVPPPWLETFPAKEEILEKELDGGL